jgi:Ca2+-binding RTX toxin-like protein
MAPVGVLAVVGTGLDDSITVSRDAAGNLLVNGGAVPIQGPTATVANTTLIGGSGAEVFTATPNGTRVRFDRVTPAPFSLDIGTAENLVLNMNGGDDSFTGSNGLATLIKLTVDGGPGNDTIIGGDGDDRLLGPGQDVLDGGTGSNVLIQ